MRRALLVAALVATSLTAGCLGSVDAATVPSSTLQQKNWEKHSESKESVAGGIGELAQIEYRPVGGQEGTGAIIATTNNIPILDESRFIPKAIEKVEQKRNIDLKKTGTTTLSLINLDSDVTADVYEFQKSGASGKAVVFTPDKCGDFVVTVGYGITGAAGISGVERSYNEAKDVARAVQC